MNAIAETAKGNMTPFCDGFDAGVRGDDPRTFPYEKLSAEASSWARGHVIGVKLREAFGPFAAGKTTVKEPPPVA